METPKQILDALHHQWLMLPETKSFLANLSARRDELLRLAEQTTDNPQSLDSDLRTKLNIAYTIRKEVLDYVLKPESITRSSGGR